MTPVSELLRRVRELNVRALSRAIKKEEQPFVEPAYRSENGSLAVDGPFDLPLRADLMRRGGDSDDAEVMVDASRGLEFEPVVFELGVCQVRVEAFDWDYAEILAEVPESLDLWEIQSWFMSWFDPEDTSTADATGLYGVVHFMSDPECAKGRLTFVVDFGSAPVEAWESLVELLVKLGAGQITTRRVAD